MGRNSHRFTENRTFGPTLDWEALPPLSAQERALGRRDLRRVVIALIGFWIVVIGALIVTFL